MATTKRSAPELNGLEAVVAKIEAMSPSDRALAEGVHALLTRVAPDLEVRTWYGMPGYALDGKVIVFFQAGEAFKTRYSTLGFQPAAQLDDGDMWATSFALLALTPDIERRITELLLAALGRTA